MLSWSWTYSGVDFTIPGTGGPECAKYLSNNQKIVETLIVVLVSSLEIWYMWPCFGPRRLSSNGINQNGVETSVSTKNNSPPITKQLLLVSLSLVFGIELGFKLASEQFIWILNPCHIVTLFQIYFLVAPASRMVSLLFRFHIHMLSGVMIAICFPVVNTRLLQFEVVTYWLQHLLLLFIPIYLMAQGGPYSVEDMTDMSWAFFSLALQFLYHFLLLQPISLVTGTNLNNIMCPAVSDPFKGKFYRMFALVHQSLLVLIHGKVYVFIAHILQVPITFSKYPYEVIDKL